jgi:4-amino-4-deoxy-L-arabinose transferase-like glycosyltransferase
MRLLFSFYFQQFYFGDFIFKYADTSSYLNPILNLINNGEYIGDKYLTDSRYFRPPVYPLFLGLFHLISPESFFDYIVASVQCLLGASSSVLIYCCILNITGMRRAAQLSSFIFATYPFAILWVPIMYTETLQLFCILLLVFLASARNITVISVILQGILVGLIVLTKQYLGLIILIPIYIIVLTARLTLQQKIAHLFIFIFSFSLMISPWVIRNYIASGKIIVLFSKTAGLRFTLNDMIAFTHFANKFDENIIENVNLVAYTGKISLSKHHEFVTKHKKDIDDAALLAHQCGGSFQEWRKQSSLEQPPYQNCNDSVASKFNLLSDKFWREVPFWEALESRRDSIWKIVSKSDLVNKSLSLNKNSMLKYSLFKYRVILIFLGLAGIIYLLMQKNKKHQQRVIVESLIFTAIVFYSFFCLIMVQAEMRYLLTPDVLITIFAGVIPAALVAKISRQRRPKAVLTPIDKSNV